MRSSADEVDAAITAAAHQIEAARAVAPEPVIVLIDGRSGSGKTTLAARLRDGWPGDVQTVALDDIYPGWDGLAAGADIVYRSVLQPLAAGRDARWRRWDWDRGAPGEYVRTRAGIPLIVEGCGALTAESASLAPIRVWLESPAAARRERALARDGDGFRPHWERWAQQEALHLADDDPVAHATIVVDIP